MGKGAGQTSRKNQTSNKMNTDDLHLNMAGIEPVKEQMTPSPFNPQAIAKEARLAICNLPDKGLVRAFIHTHGPEIDALILSAAARMVGETGAVEALEMFDKCVFPLGAMNHGCEAFAKRTAALASLRSLLDSQK